MTAVSSLAGTSRTEGSFRLPSANEEKLQMRNSTAYSWQAFVEPSTQKTVGVGTSLMLQDEPMLGTDVAGTILGAGGK